MAAVYFGHHGDTKMDAQDLAQGLIDQGLSEKGKSQAANLGRMLRGKGIKTVFSSPLKRSTETADIVADQIGAKVIVRPDLRPLDIGSLAGKKESTVKGYLEFFSKRPTLSLPEGEKFGDWYDQVKNEWAHLLGTDAPVVAVVSHSRDAHLLKHWQKEGFTASPKTIGWDGPTADLLRLEKAGNSLNIRKVA